MVPNGWDFVKLDDIAIKVMVGIASAATHAYTDSGIRMLRNLNIKDGWIDDSDILHIDNDYEVQHKNKRLKTGDILTVRTGYPGLSAVVPSIYENAQCFTSLVTRLNQAKALPDYVCRFINSEYGKKFIVSGEAGGAQKNVNAAMLKKMPIPLPPLPEQHKIAQILSTWDKAIATTEKLIDASKQQKKALVQQLLTGKKRLVDPETGKAFEGEWRKSKTPYESLPSDWSELALEKLSSFITKGATPTTYGFEWQEYGIPFLRSECVGKNGFKESGLNYICDDAHEAMARSKVYAGDILITITGNVGRVCRLPNKYPQANINQHIAKVTLKDENVCSDFIFHCLQDNKYQSNFERITTGQAYPQISLVQVRNTIVPLPPISEQQKIASVLTAADKDIELLEAKLAHFKQEKKALMQQLLTGKRRVKVAETEVA